jgi:polyisoprenyl-phosphate glycosyltransferase
VTLRASVIIPLYNEAATLPRLASALNELADIEGIDLLLVDNASGDDTADVAEQLIPKARVLRVVGPNGGFGAGIKSGLADCHAPVLAWLPGNGKVHPRDVLAVIELCERQQRMVKALRDGRPVIDQMKTAAIGWAQSLLSGVRLRDTGGTPTAVPRRLVPELIQGPDDYAFETWALWVGVRDGGVGRIRVPYGARIHGMSHWQRGFRSEMRLTKRLMQLSWYLRGARAKR